MNEDDPKPGVVIDVQPDPEADADHQAADRPAAEGDGGDAPAPAARRPARPGAVPLVLAILALIGVAAAMETSGLAALVADGRHARADALTSVAVVAAGIGSIIGWEWVDPAAGLAVSLMILRLLIQTTRGMLGRLLDAVDPEIIDRIEMAALGTPIDIVNNVLPLPSILRPGLTFAVKKLLRLGIMMLGIRLSFFDALKLGLTGVPIVVG